MSGFITDTHVALRSLRHQKAFASAALVTLALGIGANTAMFSVVYGVLLRPLPLPAPDRLVQLTEVVPGGTPALPGAAWISNMTIHAWEPARKTIGPIATFSASSGTVGLGVPRRIASGSVAPPFFEVLGVAPVAGRFFRADEAAAGAAPVVVISEEMWQEQFARDPAAIGTSIAIDDRSHQIIGVAPRGLAMPSREARFWTTALVNPPTAPGSRDVRVSGTRALARLNPGFTPADAASEGTSIARSLNRPLPFEMLFGKGGPVEVRVRTLADQMTMTIRPALMVLLVGVGLLLLIACANVANLFLSRGVSRERDFAVRVALGASRGRLLRTSLADSFVVAASGGLLGVALAWALLRALPLAAPANFPRLDAIRLDWRALAIAVVTIVLAAVVSAVIPAFRSTRSDLLGSLREGVGASSSRRTMLLRRGFLVAEAALAVMLLVGAALLGRSFVRLVQTDAGYQPANVLTARIYLPGASRGQAQTDAFVADLLPRVRALPGVVSAGVSNMAPLGASTYIAGFTLPVAGRETTTARALSYVITPGYAEALGMRLRAGRFFDARDEASGIQPVIVNEQFVTTFLKGVDPIGFRLPGSLVSAKYPSGEIVGVVANVLKDGFDQPTQAEVYVPIANGAGVRREVYLVARTSGDPMAVAASVRQVVGDIRGDAAVDRVEPLAAQISNSVAQPRFAAMVLGGFAGLALLLAAVGLYGVLSYTVARRRREIGVRTAVGATRLQTVGMIVREAMVVSIAGLALGCAGAAGLTRLMQTVLFGVTPLDPISFMLAPAALLAVALVASIVPARRAVAIDPAIALRTE